MSVKREHGSLGRIDGGVCAGSRPVVDYEPEDALVRPVSASVHGRQLY